MRQVRAGMSFDWRATTLSVLGWSLLLSGWIGFGRIAGAQSPDPAWIVIVLAAWCLCLGAAAAKRTLPRRWRLISLAAALAVAALTCRGVPVAGAFGMLCCVGAWAWLTTAALAAAGRSRPGADVEAAVLGAIVAWATTGDAGGGHALLTRMAVLGGLGLASLLLLAPAPRQGAGPALHCTSFFRPRLAESLLREASLAAASMLMLPMMCGLAWMASLCAADSVTLRAMVGWHLAAMFLPALMLTRVEALVAKAPQLCCALLGVALLAACLAAKGPFSWASMAAAGAAWSVAWAVRESRPRPGVGRLLD